MYRLILTPLDGSLLAECAIPLVAHLARQTGAHVVLVHTVPSDNVATLRGDPAPSLVEAHAYLDGVASRLADAGVEAETVVEVGPVVESILAAVHDRRPDLVVMASHAGNGPGDWIGGSVLENVLACSETPVLLVRSGPFAERQLARWLHPRLLVPLDGSVLAEAVLPHAVRLARALKGSLMLLQAICSVASTRPGTMFFTPHPDLGSSRQALHEAEMYLLRVAERLGREGLWPYVIVRSGPAADAILDETRAGVSMVVMATRGQRGRGRAPAGNVARDVIRRGDLPLLLVGPQALRALRGARVRWQRAAVALAGPTED